MTNSDNKFGTFNKRTHIYKQVSLDGSTVATEFNNVDEAKNTFLVTELQAIFDECCTNLQWALVADDNGINNGLKVTFDFGTKGGNISEDNDWAGQFNIRKSTLVGPEFPEGFYFTQTTITDTDSPEHLF